MNKNFPSSSDTNLHEALEQSTSSKKLLKIFKSEKDHKIEKSKRANERFDKAVLLYQKIMKENLPYAVFYRIDDLKSMKEQYKQANLPIVQAFISKHMFNPPTLNEAQDYFKHLKGVYRHQQPLDPEKEMQLYLIEDWLKSGSTKQLENMSFFDISDWFDKNTNASVEKKFYRVDNIEETTKKGIIYGPGDDHNWGVNASWALAITQKQIPIHFLSDLDPKHSNRSDVRAAVKHQINPSAFSLEITMALKAGYTLDFKSKGEIQLKPPSTKPDPSIFETNGTPGNGILPTKKQQVFLFNQCILAANLVKMDNDDLNKFVSQVCSESNNNKKLNLVVALSIMNEQTTLAPLLGKLEPPLIKKLDMLRSDENFSLAADLTKMSAFNAVEHIERVLSEGNMEQKLHLISALNLMNKNAYLTPFLKKLEPQQLDNLSLFLSDPKLSLEFENLKSALNDVRATENLNDLLSKDIMDLKEHINQVLSKKDNDNEKLNLLSALNLMDMDTSLTPIFTKLDSEQLNKLDTLLSEPKFSSGFDKVKFILKNVSLVNDLEKMSDSALRNHIDLVHSNNDDAQKTNLIAALNLMEKGELKPLLEKLESQQLKKLNTILFDRKFASGFEEVKNIFLPMYLEKADSDDLNECIEQMCSKKDDSEKLILSSALDSMEPLTAFNLLSKLDNEQRGKLENVLSEKFPSKFDNLEKVMGLVTLRKAKSTDLKELVNDICSGSDNDKKLELATVLYLIKTPRVLGPILNKLPPHQLSQLRDLLSQHDPLAFKEVRSIFSSIPLRKMSAENLNKHIGQVCLGHDDDNKSNLLAALSLIKKEPLTERLKQLEPQQLENLKNLLAEPKFSSGFEKLKSALQDASPDNAPLDNTSLNDTSLDVDALLSSQPSVLHQFSHGQKKGDTKPQLPSEISQKPSSSTLRPGGKHHD